jgi:PAS domain S-box-containing protein
MDHEGIMRVRNEFLVANVTDMVFSLDEEGKFVEVNPASEVRTGFVPKELVGYHYTKIVLRDDLLIVKKQIQILKSGKGTTSFEARICTTEGRFCLCLWSAYWCASEPSMLCIIHDISERRTAEDAIRISEGKIRRIIEGMPAGLLLMADGGILESCNPWLEQACGYKAVEIAGKDATLLLESNRTAPEIFAFLKEHRTGTVTANLRKKDGTTMMCNITVNMLGTDGKARLMACIHSADNHRFDL